MIIPVSRVVPSFWHVYDYNLSMLEHIRHAESWRDRQYKMSVNKIFNWTKDGGSRAC